MSNEQMQKELARLQAENTALKTQAQSKVHCKVSEKGALSIYGLGRFPITVYLSQFETLKAKWNDICAFVEAHRAEFSVKGETKKAA